MDDLISRQVVIDAVDAIGHIATMPDGDKCIRRSAVKYTLSMLPSAQPEEAIPVSWIEARIKRFMTMDNAFCGLTANIMLVMLNEWKREQEGETT